MANRPKELDLSTACLRACCMAQEADGKASIVRFQWGDVLSEEYPEFERWLEDRVNTVLGAKAVSSPQVVHYHQHRGPSKSNECGHVNDNGR